MSKYKPLMLTLASCGLLSGCLQPVLPTPTMQPVLHVGQANNRATEWNQLARYHYERGQLDLALGAYAQSLALDAQQLEARNAVAVIQAQQGHLDEARKTLLALVNDYPGQAQPHTNLGYVYYLQGDNVAAQKVLQRAMALGGGAKAFQNLQMAENALRLAQGGAASGQTPLDTGIVARSTSGSGDVATASVTPPLSEAPAEARAVLSPRSLPESTSVTPEPQQIASRMELVQLAPSIFELKPRATAPALAAASTPAAVPALAAAPAIPRAASKTPTAVPAPATAPATPPTVAKAPTIAAAPAVAPAIPSAVIKAPAVGVAPTTAPATLTVAAKAPVIAPAAATAPAASPVAVKAPAAALTLTTALATPPAAAKPPAAPAAKPVLARIEVSNGNGITGMAKHYRMVLGHLGILVDRISNDKPYRQVATTIQYRPGFEQHAANLQKALQGKVQLASRELQSSDVRLVLGKDAAHSLAAASEAAHLQLNAAVGDDK